MMHRQRNYIYPDKDSLVAAFVCEFQNFLSEREESGVPVHIAFSGGSTPLDLFRKLAEETSAGDWSGIHLYWVDERCVPPEHADSNYGNAHKLLISPLGLPAGQVHRIRGEEDPEEEARRYAGLLKDHLPLRDGYPEFDWIWLGLGSDGHTASIFPGQLALWKSEHACVATTHPDTGQHRITLSGGVINAARRVSFLASGRSKAGVLKEILMKEGNFLDYPAAYVNPHTDYLEWYLDKEATTLL